MPSAFSVLKEVRRLIQELDINTRPTPVDLCIAYADLTVDYEVAWGQLPKDEQHKLLNDAVLQSALEKSWGLLDRRNKLIYIKAGMVPGRQNFIQLHELGHYWMRWQRRHGMHLDGGQNLEPRTNKLYEWQANVFAAETLFQLETFEQEARDLKFDLKTVLKLSSQYGASVHATLRRFVERHDQRCFLLILEDTPTINSKGIRHKVTDICWSKPFRKKYPSWQKPRWVPASAVQPMELRQVAYELSTQLPFEVDHQVVACDVQGFKNDHHILLFARPKDGQRVPSHTSKGKFRL